MNQPTNKEKAMMDFFVSVSILVSYNNQMTLLDEVEKILNKEQRQLFHSLRKNTIENDEPTEEEISKYM